MATEDRQVFNPVTLTHNDLNQVIFIYTAPHYNRTELIQNRFVSVVMETVKEQYLLSVLIKGQSFTFGLGQGYWKRWTLQKSSATATTLSL